MRDIKKCLKYRDKRGVSLPYRLESVPSKIRLTMSVTHVYMSRAPVSTGVSSTRTFELKLLFVSEQAKKFWLSILFV